MSKTFSDNVEDLLAHLEETGADEAEAVARMECAIFAITGEKPEWVAGQQGESR